MLNKMISIDLLNNNVGEKLSFEINTIHSLTITSFFLAS